MKTANRPLFAAAISAIFALAAIDPAAAMPIGEFHAPASSDIVKVSGHHDHHHWHRSGHRGHGYDGYYDDNDDSGVLFKSFVTGTLFDRDSQAYSDHSSACAARYRSYDPTDNSYQPSRGPRTQCR